MRRIPTVYANKTTVVTAFILAISTLAIDFWNRGAYNTIHISTSGEQNAAFLIAFLIFVITLLVLYSAPLIVALFTEKSENNKKWPIFETCIAVGGILIFYIFLRLQDFIPHITGFLLLYTAMVIAYSFMVKRLVGCWREQNWGGILINLVGVLMVGLVLYVANSLVVFIAS